MNSVRSRSTRSSRRRIADGWVVSRTWKPVMPNVRRITSGARLEPPIPSSTTSSKSRGERLQLVDPLEHPPGLVEPAEPVRLVGSRPDRRVARPDAVDDLDGLERGHRRNSRTSRSNSSGRSRLGMCAARGIDVRCASGILSASLLAIACMSSRSSSPVRISVGARTSPTRSARSGTSSSSCAVSNDGHLQLESAALHLADARPQVGVDLGRRAARAVDPHAEIHLDGRVDVSTLERGLLFGPARPGSPRTSLVPGAARIHEHELLDRAPGWATATSSATRPPSEPPTSEVRLERRARRAGRPGRGRASTSRGPIGDSP